MSIINLDVNKKLISSIPVLIDPYTKQELHGASGTLYSLKEDVALKLYNKYKKIILKNDLKYASDELKLCNYNQEDQNKIIELSNRQSAVKHTDFPIGIATFNGLMVGVLIKFYKNSVSLYNYFIQKPEQFSSITHQILDNISEMHDQFIYNTDMHIDNILVDKSDTPHIIDLDGNYVIVADSPIPSYNRETYYYFKTIITDYARLIDILNISLREQIDELPNTYDGICFAIDKVESFRVRQR